MAFRTIGKALPRIEGEGKVTGQTKYAADLPFEGLLWAKVLRSPIPHGRIKNIDTAKAKALAGVRAVLIGADVPDVYVGTRLKDLPVLANDKVRICRRRGRRCGGGQRSARRGGAGADRRRIRGASERRPIRSRH